MVLVNIDDLKYVGEQNCFIAKQTNLSKIAVEISRQQAARAIFWE